MDPMLNKHPQALQGLRVLDVGGEISNYCGRLFAQLGAEVILLEPVEGSLYRSTFPRAGQEGVSLRFAYDNADKKSLGLDVTSPSGKDAFINLVKSADLVIDDKCEHDLLLAGLGYEELARLNPRLITTVITPFGLAGPYVEYQATDLTCLAFGGMLWLGGYADGSPIQAAGQQAYRAGSLFGAVASMAALLSSDGERGELIDVSIQECVALGLENAVQFYDLERHVRRRYGGRQKQAGFGVFPCRDGYIFLIAGGIGGNRFWANFTHWLRHEQVAGAESLEDGRWNERAFVESDAAKEEFERIFTPYSKVRSKEELLAAGLEWNVPLAPIKTLAEVHNSVELQERGFFAKTQINGRYVDMPGPPYQLSDTPWRHESAAPKLGAHTDELLSGLGYATTDITEMRAKGVLA